MAKDELPGGGRSTRGVFEPARLLCGVLVELELGRVEREDLQAGRDLLEVDGVVEVGQRPLRRRTAVRNLRSGPLRQKRARVSVVVIAERDVEREVQTAVGLLELGFELRIVDGGHAYLVDVVPQVQRKVAASSFLAHFQDGL